MQRYTDRRDAGAALADALAKYAGRPDVVVLGLPRGGVPVAYEVATGLGAPLDVLVVRKLGLPGHPELAMGAIGSDGVLVLDDRVIRWASVTRDELREVIDRERAELDRREQLLRGHRPPLDVRGRIAIVVDDGLATGSTMRAAIAVLRSRDPARVVVAVPIAAASACQDLGEDVDEIVCATTPEPFHAVGLWYHDFSPTTDEEVVELLARADHRRRAQPPAAPASEVG